MRKNLLILIIVVAFALSSQAQKSKQSSPIGKIEWLIGSWQGTYQGKPFYEAWRKFNDSTLVNFTIEISNNDTIVKEDAAIRYDGKTVIYGSKTAQWKLTDLSETSMTFANDTLKFANKITWSHSKDDHWLTVIKNPTNTINYDLIRVKWLERYVDAYISKMRRR
jgi:hypothetical protein